MGSSNTVISLRNVSVYINDGSSHSIALRIGEGNVTYDEKLQIQYMKDRGILDTVRLGEDEPMDVRFDMQWIYITAASGDSAPSFEDALKQRGPASSWTSASSNTCEPYAVDIVLYDVPCATDTPESIVFPDFRYESLSHDPKAGQIVCSGKCNSTQAIPNRGALSSY